MKEGKSYDTVVDMNSSNMCYDNFCDIPPPQTEQTKELIPRVEYVSFDLENTELCMFQIIMGFYDNYPFLIFDLGSFP